MGEKFVFTPWYSLLVLSGRSCTSQPGTQILYVNLGEWLFPSIVILAAASLAYVVTSLRFSVLTNDMRPGIHIPVPDKIQRDFHRVDPYFLLFVHSFILFIHLFTCPSIFPCIHMPIIFFILFTSFIHFYDILTCPENSATLEDIKWKKGAFISMKWGNFSWIKPGSWEEEIW